MNNQKKQKVPQAIPNTTSCWLAIKKNSTTVALLLKLLGTPNDLRTIIYAPRTRGYKREPTHNNSCVTHT